MSLTTTQARDEMLDLFRVKWVADTPAVNNGVAPPVEWPNVEALEPPPIDAAWARATVVHATGGQRTMGGIGQRRFGRTGVVMIQIFVPRNLGQTLSDALCDVAVSAFEGKKTAGGVWFRNVRVNEVAQSPDQPNLQANVIAEFDYDKMI